MTAACENCGRPARHEIHEADTGARIPVCTPQGCPQKAGPQMVPCLNCNGSGDILNPFTGPLECEVCRGVGQTTATRHNAWLAAGVLIDPDCWWQRVGNIAALHGPDGFVGQVVHLGISPYWGEPYWAKFRTGATATFDTPERAEEFLYILMDDNSGSAK